MLPIIIYIYFVISEMIFQLEIILYYLTKLEALTILINTKKFSKNFNKVQFSKVDKNIIDIYSGPQSIILY